MIAWFSSKKKNVSSKKDDFISTSSHARRSPLSVIKWYTEILLDEDTGPLNEDQRKYLKVIESSNQRAIDLIRSLLNVSRLDLGTFSISPEMVSLSDIIKEVTDLYCKDASKKHVVIEYKEGARVSPISVDKHVCLLVVKQLLLNAIVFSQENGIVHVVTSLVSKGSKVSQEFFLDESIVLTITDAGLGIPEKDKAKIFTRTFRASNVKDQEGSDGGLGLYITKTIINITGGKIWFESEEGKGTTFYVSFPTKGMKKKEGTTVLE